MPRPTPRTTVTALAVLLVVGAIMVRLRKLRTQAYLQAGLIERPGHRQGQGLIEHGGGGPTSLSSPSPSQWVPAASVCPPSPPGAADLGPVVPISDQATAQSYAQAYEQTHEQPPAPVPAAVEGALGQVLPVAVREQHEALLDQAALLQKLQPAQAAAWAAGSAPEQDQQGWDKSGRQTQVRDQPHWDGRGRDEQGQPERDHPTAHQPRHARRRSPIEHAGRMAEVLLALAATVIVWLTAFAFAPTMFGWDSRVVISGSMEPRIHTGDVVVIKKTTQDLAAGHLVTFHDQAQPGRIMTHRLVQRREDGQWITKGDANANQDSTPVPESAIIGQPKLVVPAIGLPTYWRATGTYPTARLVLLGLVGVALLVVRALGTNASRAASVRVASDARHIWLPAQRQAGAPGVRPSAGWHPQQGHHAQQQSNPDRNSNGHSSSDDNHPDIQEDLISENHTNRTN